MGRGDRDQSLGRIPHLARCAARHEEAQVGPHHQHRVRARAGRERREGGLRRGEAWHRRPDQSGGDRDRERRHYLQRDLSRLGADPAGAAADRRAREDRGQDRAAGEQRAARREAAYAEILHAGKRRCARGVPRRRCRRDDHRLGLFHRWRLGRGVSKRPKAASDKAAPANAKKINLGLQGGGAHGAFTWGVLDHLLADPRIDIEGISGTSAGAVNAVMLADGLARGGPEAARQRLADFWRAASLDGNLPDLQRSVIDRLFSFTPYEGSPVQAWFNAVSHYMSPYDLNPLNINPLRDLIERFVDFDAVRACREISLFISATNVHTGRLRVFPHDKVTADVVMAAACLPFLFRGVEIDGVPEWDGG